MGLVWTRKLSVGNAIIDSEHRNLIGMARGVMHEVRSGDAASRLQAIDMLESWLCIHFENEERIAQSIGFSFERHRIGQQYLLKEFRHMRKELASMSCPWSGGTIKYYSRHLKSWMIDAHIIKLDMLMKPALQPHGYGFLPGCEDGATGQARKGAEPRAVIPGLARCGCGCGCDGQFIAVE